VNLDISNKNMKECINPKGIALEEAMRKEVAKQNIIKTIRDNVSLSLK